ncbi:MAG: DUF4382 domain-containing protein [Candidatus Marinimicrobia bacterium]|nr:DUF4382 domain-containing protein [Candidatus Neomarinimicrobiota bacterium]
MKTKLIFLFSILSLVLMTCDSASDETKTGTLVVQAFDAPFKGNVEHIYLDINSVSIHKSDATDSTSGWTVVSDEDTVIDFLSLVNGEMINLVDAEFDEGFYSQIRLMLGDSSVIVVDGVSYELKVPSGSQSGIKLNLDFEIKAGEIMELYLDFDAEKSIHKHPTQDRYSLQPTFRIIKKVLSGTISGKVTKSDQTTVANASVYAVSGSDSVTTLTNTDGFYQLVVLAGTYDISAAADGFTADTLYQAVTVQAEDDLKDRNFIMQ